MSPLLDAVLNLGPQLAEHVLLCAAAVALGIAVALPLAVWASRSPTVARFALGFASLVQTIPALALLALFFPILLAARTIFGEDLPTLGFLPAWLALALYALLPILRNAVTALANLDDELIEAADGLGMTAWQKLRLVQAPLAAPFVMAGIRTASVWTIGAATLATTIGQRSLGDPIFAGLQTQNWVLVLAGCVASAGLALVADALFGLVERGFASRRPALVITGVLVALAGIAGAAASTMDWRGDARESVVIGAKSFSEQYILARAIGSVLEDAGFAVEYREGLGSAVLHNAVASSAIDISVDYTGTLWTNQLGRTDNPGRNAMFDEIVQWERENTGARVLGRLGFENAYGLAVTQKTAARYGLATIADLAGVAPQLTIGGDPEWFERPEWNAVRDAYGLDWPGFSDMLKDTPPGNGGKLLLPWFAPEIVPTVLTPGVKRRELDPLDVPGNCRAVVEAQMMSMRIHSEWMGIRPEQIYATGGASSNQEILQVMANVHACPVYQFTSTNGASLGAALRAAQACLGDAGSAPAWRETVKGFTDPIEGSQVRPQSGAVAVYDDLVKAYAAFENENRS